MNDGDLKLWPRIEELSGDMLLGPDYPQLPMQHYISLDALAGFIGDSGFSTTIIADAPPTGFPGRPIRIGDTWWDSSDGGGQLYILYDDGSSAQWVPATNQRSVAATTITTAHPASGAILVLGGDTYVDTAALAALTLRLPSMPVAGHRVEVCFAAPVVALTVQDAAGAAVAGAPTNAFGPGAALVFRYANGGPGWVSWK